MNPVFSTPRILFISNGHGEDLNASEVLRAMRRKYPQIDVAAMPLVGEGNAYRRLDVPIIAPTRSLPSGGFAYLDNLKLLADFRAGLLGLVWQQVQALRRYGRQCDLVFATGDVVVLMAAALTGSPYASFLVSSSSFYENRMKLPFPADRLVRSPRCRLVFTRDRYTAEQFHAQGLQKAVFAGYPIMDVLTPTGKDLQLLPQVPTIALLPGSRLPEACHNLELQLQLARTVAQALAPQSVQFRAAIVPSMMNEKTLRAIAIAQGWEYHPPGKLVCQIPSQIPSQITVSCFADAFADILHQADLVVGMAGTAVEQAVGLGKPVVQILGRGPQFVYRFAEAQMRLLGTSVQTIGTEAATPATLQEAARVIQQTLGDREYLQACKENGLERVGSPGGSEQIGDRLYELLSQNG